MPLLWTKERDTDSWIRTTTIPSLRFARVADLGSWIPSPQEHRDGDGTSGRNRRRVRKHRASKTKTRACATRRPVRPKRMPDVVPSRVPSKLRRGRIPTRPRRTRSLGFICDWMQLVFRPHPSFGERRSFLLPRSDRRGMARFANPFPEAAHPREFQARRRVHRIRISRPSPSLRDRPLPANFRIFHRRTRLGTAPGRDGKAREGRPGVGTPT